jgi:hypothetical protein
VASLDHLGKCRLQSIAGQLMITKHADQKPKQLVRVLLEQSRDDCGIEFAFVVGAQSGVPAVSSLRRLPYGMRDRVALLAGGANFFQEWP